MKMVKRLARRFAEKSGTGNSWAALRQPRVRRAEM